MNNYKTFYNLKNRTLTIYVYIHLYVNLFILNERILLENTSLLRNPIIKIIKKNYNKRNPISYEIPKKKENSKRQIPLFTEKIMKKSQISRVPKPYNTLISLRIFYQHETINRIN